MPPSSYFFLVMSSVIISKSDFAKLEWSKVMTVGVLILIAGGLVKLFRNHEFMTSRCGSKYFHLKDYETSVMQNKDYIWTLLL